MKHGFDIHYSIEPSNYYGFCFKWVKIGLGAVHEMRWLT